MKKLLSVIIVITLALGAITCLGGCGTVFIDKEESDTPVNLSLVMCNRRNFTKMNFNNESVYDAIYEACYTYGSISSVIVDGRPSVHCSYNIAAPDVSVDKTKRAQIAKENAAAIIAACSSAAAKTPEADTLGAITLSAQALSSAKDGEVKKMVVYDSFVSTTSYLNMLKNNFFNADTETVVNKLKAKSAIPDLTGIDITVVGMGQVCDEQADLPADYQAKLEELWRAIFEAGNANSVTVDKMPLAEVINDADLPEVSEVPMPAKGIDDIGGYYTFNNDTVKFLPDSCVFADESAAVSALADMANEIKANPSMNITIAGTTASADGDGVALSKSRAEAVKSILVSEFGISGDRIDTLGLGKKDCAFRVDDTNADGTLNESVAPQNRAIYVFDSNSDIADSLRSL